VTWQENWKTCCSMNMTPVEFTSNAQIQELMTQSKGIYFSAWVSRHPKLMRARAVPLHAFWTGGTRRDCIGQLAWCFALRDSIWRLNVLANSDESAGSCVLISRVRNAKGDVVYAPLTEVCSVRASLACVADAGTKPAADKSSVSIHTINFWRLKCHVHILPGASCRLLQKSHVFQPTDVREKRA
jgi:hypothetical protein